MFGIDGKILVIAVVALVLLGPQKLPGILRTLGKGYVQLRRMTMDVRSTLEREIRAADETLRADPAETSLPVYQAGGASEQAQTEQAQTEQAQAIPEAKPTAVQGSLFDYSREPAPKTDADQEKTHA